MTIFYRFFLYRSTENFVGKTFRALFQKSSGGEKIMDKRGKSRFSIKNLLSHGAEKLRGGILQGINEFGY